MELPKTYNPKEVEADIYKKWEEGGFFAPQGDGEPFTILMPPTNANGDLHAGHGLVMTIEDIMIRYKRMAGFKTLWLPGNDHAGFETQVVYEKKLEKEGRSRLDMDPKELYDEIMEFTQSNRSNINSQVRQLGASCDWSREKFTLDDDIIQTVYATFKKLSDDKLLYRGKRIVSWCPRHQTSFSDLEIKDEERTDKFYYLKYGPFVIGTSRPETKFGDKYIVMHPDDERYSEYKDGQQLELEWINGPITATIVKDESVDMEFGTGVMTITPWHDATDFDIATRHKLDMEQIIDLKGKLLSIAGEFEGMHISKARDLIVEKLEKKGLVDKIDDNYKHVIHTCYRCSTIIEPQILPQWFVKMQSLAKPAIEKIESGEIKFIPEHYKKIVLHWLNNIMDWNISRQIVWGIPIPAKLCDSCDDGFVDLDDSITECATCGGSVRKDIDTFDTWFSSGQWPFATLGYPDGDDFKTFFPTDVMETAGDIIFFWVARMIMLSLYVTEKIPFSTVYLHGMVQDAKGQKMSKSRGNVINPLNLTDEFGTDAFRMGMIVGNTPGTSLALAPDRIKGYKYFANKVWNISRFILMNVDSVPSGDVSDEDQKYIDELSELTKDLTKDMDEFRFYLAAEKIYHYIWHTLADKILEQKKDALSGDDEAAKKSAQILLFTILTTSLKLLHPFMPFVTEHIWSQLPDFDGKKKLIVETWPA